MNRNFVTIFEMKTEFTVDYAVFVHVQTYFLLVFAICLTVYYFLRCMLYIWIVLEICTRSEKV
jgi:hypothetical protein